MGAGAGNGGGVRRKERAARPRQGSGAVGRAAPSADAAVHTRVDRVLILGFIQQSSSRLYQCRYRQHRPQAAAAGRGIKLAEHSARGRDGLTGARRKGDIGFAALRGGTVVGDHSVIFAGDGERIVLSHHVEDREVFARGALKAALWARDQKPGLYSMADVLGIAD